MSGQSGRQESKPPLVTVVTPSLNQGTFLAATIESVLSQDYSPIEFFVVDGGSTDQTISVLESYRGRIKWLSEPDDGQADAINKGFALAQGSLIAWLNADDAYTPGAISLMVQYLIGHPECALVYGHADIIDRDGRLLRPARQVERFDRKRLLNAVDFVAQPATLFSRSAFEDVGGLDASLNWSFDYDLWLKLSARYQVGFLDRVLAQMRVHDEAKTSTGGLPRLVEVERMIRQHGRNTLPAGFSARMAWLSFVAALQAVQRSSRSMVVAHLANALRYAVAYAAYRLAQLPRMTHFNSAARSEDVIPRTAIPTRR